MCVALALKPLNKHLTCRSEREKRDGVSSEWNDTPHRPRPPALRGLLVHHPIESSYQTGWATDESCYNEKANMWSTYDGHFGGDAQRSEYLPERMLEAEQRRTSYMDRWHAKFN